MSIPIEAVCVEDMHNCCLAGGSYIYFLSLDGVCVYVGQTINLGNRIKKHLGGKSKQFDAVHYIHVDAGLRLSVEQEWISRLSPRFNGKTGRPKLPDDQKTRMVGLSLSPQVIKWLDIRCAELGCSRSKVATDILRRALRRSGRKG